MIVNFWLLAQPGNRNQCRNNKSKEGIFRLTSILTREKERERKKKRERRAKSESERENVEKRQFVREVERVSEIERKRERNGGKREC